MVRNGKVVKNHQCWWTDLHAWVEQLYSEYGFQTSIELTLPAECHHLNPGVAVTLRKPAVGLKGTVEYREWAIFNPEETGGAEAVALRLISRMLLTLDNEQALAQAKQQSLFG